MKLQHELNKICKPLMEASEISTFYYARVFPNQQCVILCNKNDWVNYKIENNFTIFSPVNLPLKTNVFYNFVPKIGNNLHNRIISEAENYFKIFNPIDIFFQNSSFLELFSFAADNSNFEIYNWYINNLSLINKFVLYIKNKIDNLIQNNDVDPIKINDSSRISIFSKEQLQNNEIIIPNTSIILELLGEKIILTQRESDIVKYVKKGYINKKIAAQLNISHRTVEDHLQHIKKKLNCVSKSDLINILESQNLSSLLY